MAHHRHKRDTEARRKPKALAVIGPLAVLATASVVTLGVLAADPRRVRPGAARPPQRLDRCRPRAATTPVTRSEDRVKATDVARPAAAGVHVEGGDHRPRSRPRRSSAGPPTSSTSGTSRATRPSSSASSRPARRSLVTGREMWGRTEIVLKGKSRWVTDGYLSDEKPPTLGGDCTNGTSVPGRRERQHRGRPPRGLRQLPRRSPSTARCAAVAATTAPAGPSTSWSAASAAGQVANFVRENYAALGVSYVIYSQSIWSVERSRRGLARHVQPRLGHRQPLRPRARLDLLSPIVLTAAVAT